MEIKNKKMKGSKLLLIGIVFAVIALMIFPLMSAASTTGANVCCERTKSGAWCQNDAQSNCNTDYKIAPTSCESTSYCKKGCCFDLNDGLCMENTPEKICGQSSGIWAGSADCSVSQCKLGCCVLGDQGAFVTLTRCKALSGFYGLETDFRSSITSETECFAVAGASDVGACVYETEVTGNSCVYETRAKCPVGSTSGEISNSTSSGNQTAVVGFYKDILCTAPELNTKCGKSTKTTIIEGKDEVYYTDTCGNIANIYDASKYNDNNYWKNVYKKSQSCGYGSSNAASKTCGNCDYSLGSIGKKSTGSLASPTYGTYVCADLACKKEGRKHGESWCGYDTPNGNGKDTVGSGYFRSLCLNGEVITESCGDFRSYICLENKFGTFSEAACRVNRWQTCNQQVEEGDCENTALRDCTWINGFYFSGTTDGVIKSNNKTDNPTPSGLCAPNYPPGLVFWADGGTTSTTTATGAAQSFTSGTGTGFTSGTGEGFGTGYVNPSSGSMGSSSQCSAGNANIKVTFTREERPAVIWDKSKKEGEWKCTGDYCQYVDGEYVTKEAVVALAEKMNEICYSLGDCGGYINWQGKYTEEGYAAYFNGKRLAGSGGAEILKKSETTTTGKVVGTGNIIKDLMKKIAGKS